MNQCTESQTVLPTEILEWLSVNNVHQSKSPAQIASEAMHSAFYLFFSPRTINFKTPFKTPLKKHKSACTWCM